MDHNLKKISRLLYSIWMTAAVYFRPVLEPGITVIAHPELASAQFPSMSNVGTGTIARGRIALLARAELGGEEGRVGRCGGEHSSAQRSPVIICGTRDNTYWLWGSQLSARLKMSLCISWRS